MIGTIFGTTVLVVFLLVAVQVVFALYARSAVGAAAYDGARLVSGADLGGNPESADDAGQLTGSEATADSVMRADLGSYGASAIFSWQVSEVAVRLTVSVRSPTLLPDLPGLDALSGLSVVSRTVVMQREYVH